MHLWWPLTNQDCIGLPLQVLLSKGTPPYSPWPLRSYLLPWTWAVLLPLRLHRDLLRLRRWRPSLLSHLRFPWVEGATGKSLPPRRAWPQWSPEQNFAVFRGWDAGFISLIRKECKYPTVAGDSSSLRFRLMITRQAPKMRLIERAAEVEDWWRRWTPFWHEGQSSEMTKSLDRKVPMEVNHRVLTSHFVSFPTEGKQLRSRRTAKM